MLLPQTKLSGQPGRYARQVSFLLNARAPVSCKKVLHRHELVPPEDDYRRGLGHFCAIPTEAAASFAVFEGCALQTRGRGVLCRARPYRTPPHGISRTLAPQPHSIRFADSEQG